MIPCCGAEPAQPLQVTRRDLLRSGALLGMVAVGGSLPTTSAEAAPATAASGRVIVKPRSAWARNLVPRGPLEVEAPGDVRFLLVHHSATPNGYAQADVPGLLRDFYDLHTGSDRGWPDVAYNFLVDAFGGVWEGRQGSMTTPVKGSATGGSQGFALLCCYIGDFRAVAPTAAAEASMLALLAWLADTYAINTAPGAVTSFVSRGSNRHPAGTPVTARTISAHRDMSKTDCPGDVVYTAVRARYPRDVSAIRRRIVPEAVPPTSTAQTATASPASGGSSGPVRPPKPKQPAPLRTELSSRQSDSATTSDKELDDELPGGTEALAGGAAAAVAAAAGLLWRRGRTSQRAEAGQHRRDG